MIVKDGLIGVTGNITSHVVVFHQNRPLSDVRDVEMAASSTATTTEKGRRIVGAERATLAKDLVKRYTSGESIRALASSTGRSYGFVHRVLTESGVQLRQRGGARRRKKAA